MHDQLPEWVARLGAAYVILAAAISSASYRHAGRPYARDKHAKMPSVTSFKLVYVYLRVSTLVTGAGAFLFDHPVLLKLYSSVPAVAIGVGISALGLAGFIWSKIVLGAQYSPCFDAMRPNEIVRHGPYGWIRHPIYTANVFLLLGIAIASSSTWMYINTLLVAGYYLYTAPIEERWLSANTSGYAEYTNRTRRFIPGVW